MLLRTRIATVAAAAVALAVALAAVAAYFLVHRELFDSLDSQLAARTDMIAFRATHLPDPEAIRGIAGGTSSPSSQPVGVVPLNGISPKSPRLVPIFTGKRQSNPQGVSVQFIDRHGNRLLSVDNGPNLSIYKHYIPFASHRLPSMYASVKIHGVPFQIFVHSLAPRGYVIAAASLQEIDRQLHDLALLLGGVVLVGIILAATLGWLVARTALLPLGRLTAALGEIAETSDLSRRVDVARKDELGQLATRFNHLLSALEDSQDSQRQLVEDAAHELRTPMTSLRTNSELIKRMDMLAKLDQSQLADDMISQIDELTSLVSGLVTLARGSGAVVPASVFSLEDLVNEEISGAGSYARAKQVRISADLQQCWVNAPRERVGSAVSNLLDNAIKWSPTGGEINVSLKDGELLVVDEGPGIPEDHLPHIFDRFYRAPNARSMPGSGLGLAIVKQISIATGGHVSASNLDSGGAAFRLCIPTSAPAPAGQG